MADNLVISEIRIKATTEGVAPATAEVKDLDKSLQGIEKTTIKDDKARLSAVRGFERMERSVNAVAREQYRHNLVQLQGARLLEQYPDQQGRVNETLALSEQRLNQVTLATNRGANANRFASHELVNLSRQAQDVAVSLGSGQSFGTVLLQQGTQIADVIANSTGSIRGLFNQIVAGARSVLTPLVTVTTGIIGIGTGIAFAAANYASGQREIEKALMGIGRQSGTTVGDINKIAQSAASATGLSIGEARDAAVEFARTGQIYKNNIQSAVDVTKNFSIVTGQDTTEAAKTLADALSGDLATGAENLNKKLGFLSGSMRQSIINMQNQNNVQGAQKIILDAVAQSTKNATDLLGPFEKAWIAVGNAASYAATKIGEAIVPRKMPIEEVETKIRELEGSTSQPARGGRLGQQQMAMEIAQLARLRAEYERLKATKDSVDSNKFSTEADNAIRAMIPEIAQIEKLERVLADLRRAQLDPEVMGKMGLSADIDRAIAAAELLKMKLKESADETARRNEKELEIAGRYKDVGISTALILEQQKGQLAVAEAVGGAQKMAAQHAATYADLINKGKTQTEALALADSQRAIAQAQINSQAKEHLLVLKDQEQVARAVFGVDKMRAEAAVTANGLVRDGVGAYIAQATAAQQLRNSVAQASAAIENQTRSIEQQTELIKARVNGTEAAVLAEQAYENAIKSGADAMSASGLQAAVLDNQRLQAAQKLADANAKAAQSEEQRMQAANDNVDRQIQAINEELQLIEARRTGSEASVKAEQAFNRALREGADLLHAEALQMATRRSEEEKEMEALNKKRVPTPGGFLDSVMILVESLRYLEGKFGAGGVDKKTTDFGGIPITTGTPNEGGLQTYLKTLFDKGLVGGDEWNKTLQQLRDMQAKQKSFDDLINPVEDLTKSVNDLNDTMQITLDPIYSQGHNAKIGYYEVGGGSGSKGYVTGSPALPQMTSPPIQPSPGPTPRGYDPRTGWTPGITQPNQYPYPFILHAATGFSGIMGGSGGTDSQLFQALVSPGEHIEITPPRKGWTPGIMQPSAEIMKRYNDNQPKTVVNNTYNNRTQNFVFAVAGGASDLSRRQTRRQLTESYGRDAAAVA